MLGLFRDLLQLWHNLHLHKYLLNGLTADLLHYINNQLLDKKENKSKEFTHPHEQ